MLALETCLNVENDACFFRAAAGLGLWCTTEGEQEVQLEIFAPRWRMDLTDGREGKQGEEVGIRPCVGLNIIAGETILAC